MKRLAAHLFVASIGFWYIVANFGVDASDQILPPPQVIGAPPFSSASECAANAQSLYEGKVIGGLVACIDSHHPKIWLFVDLTDEYPPATK